MRIFYVAQSTPNEIGLPGSRLWYVNLYLPLRDLGHELIVFDHEYLHVAYDLDLALPGHQEVVTRCRPQVSEELVRQVESAHQKAPIDLFFSYFSSAHIEPDAIREIGKMGIITLNWYCNASYQFHLVQEIAPAYDYCLVPEKFRLDDYRRVGARPLYCQEAANPTVYKPYDVPLQFDVTFVGQRYGNRPTYIRSLIDAKIQARAWGPHWQDPPPSRPLWRRIGGKVKRTFLTRRPGMSADVPREYCGPPLTDQEYIEMYSRSKISLGFSSVAEVPLRSGPIKQVRLRDLEATMSGAFYLVEYFEELAELFELDKEIVCFNDADELVDKARYYLTHDTERNHIREAGMRRARSEHTWHRRFEMVFRHIGLF